MGTTALELTTQIPKEKLLSSICEFYWEMGYRTISVYGDTAGDRNHAFYDPAYEIVDISKCKRIQIHTNTEKENKPVFDSVQINLEESGFDTKIEWSVIFGTKNSKWEFIYLAPILISAYYTDLFQIKYFPDTEKWHVIPLLFVFMTILVISYLPLFLFVRISGNYQQKKYSDHPSIEKYRINFEAFIRNIEDRIFIDTH